jgi:hypothetical protein
MVTVTERQSAVLARIVNHQMRHTSGSIASAIGLFAAGSDSRTSNGTPLASGAEPGVTAIDDTR